MCYYEPQIYSPSDDEPQDDESYVQFEQEYKDMEDESIGIENFDIAVQGGRESASLRAMKKVLPILRLERSFAYPPLDERK